MIFNELIKLMQSRGIFSLANIARELKVSPQSVSNWKARGQVPYKYVVYIQNKYNIDNTAVHTQDVDNTSIAKKYTHNIDDSDNKTNTKPLESNDEKIYPTEQYSFEEDTLSIFDILLVLSRHIKLIIIIPTIFCIYAIINVQFISTPIYLSKAKFMSAGSEGSKTGMTGIASQFGINFPVGKTGSTKWSYEEVIRSRTMARSLLKQRFDTEKYGIQKELLQILTYGNNEIKFSRDILEIEAVDKFLDLISINYNIKTRVFTLTVSTIDPKLSSDIARVIIDKLDEHLQKYNAHKNTETRQFIEERLIETKIELEAAEEALKEFRERNRSILESPQLQLEQERLGRSLAVLIGVFTTLKQQLETAKIEEVKESDYVVILDPPEIPIEHSKPEKKKMVFLAGLLGISLGIALSFIREYAENREGKEKKKMEQVKSLLIKDIAKIYHTLQKFWKAILPFK